MMQMDKRLHMAVGFAVQLASGLPRAWSGVPLELCLALGLAAVVVIAKAKEDYDKKHPATRTADGWDAYATVAGAPPAQLLLAALYG